MHEPVDGGERHAESGKTLFHSPKGWLVVTCSRPCRRSKRRWTKAQNKPSSFCCPSPGAAHALFRPGAGSTETEKRDCHWKRWGAMGVFTRMMEGLIHPACAIIYLNWRH